MANQPVDVSVAEHATAALAFELAAQLVPWPQILHRFGISDQQFELLLRAPMFQKMLQEAKAKWDSPLTVAERTRLKAQFSLEACLLPLHAIVHDGKTPTQSRVDAAKLIASVAGLSRGEGVQANTEKFSLTINLGPNHQVGMSLKPPAIDADMSDAERLG